jgi:hypothetical protein
MALQRGDIKRGESLVKQWVKLKSYSRSVRFTPRTNWIWGWLSPRAGLDAVAKRKIPSQVTEN